MDSQRQTDQQATAPTPEPAPAFTPGPWETHYSHDATGYPCFYVHGLAGDEKRDEAVLTANAHLIAAAPDMYEALKALMRFWHDSGLSRCDEDNCGCIEHLATAALAKAEGR